MGKSEEYMICHKNSFKFYWKIRRNSIFICDLNKPLCHWYPIKNPNREKYWRYDIKITPPKTFSGKI